MENQDHLSIEQHEPTTLTLNAINLSEDLSSISSKNDEILVLIYQCLDSTISNSPVISKQLVFNENERSKDVAFTTSKTSNTLLFILIEQDDETPIEQLDPIFRYQLTQILNAFSKNDSLGLEKYLGDEDLLGIKFLNASSLSSTTFSFKGIQKMDRYDYSVTIKGSKL